MLFAIHVLARVGDVYRCDACGHEEPYERSPFAERWRPEPLGYDCPAVRLPPAPDRRADDYARSRGYADWRTYIRAVHEKLRDEERWWAAIQAIVNGG